MSYPVKFLHASDHRPVKADVIIGGNLYSFIHLEVHQNYGKHSSFKILLDNNVLNSNSAINSVITDLGSSFLEDPLQKMTLLGQPVRIVFYDEVAKNRGFIGVIKKVSLTAYEGKNGCILLEGLDGSSALDTAKRYDVYSNMSLNQVYGQLTENTSSSHFRSTPNTMFSSKIDFLMQWNMTNFEYLQYLAFLYGENLYWDGHDLCFGQWKESSIEELTYDKDIESFEFVSQIVPNKQDYHHYIPEQDLMLREPIPKKIEDSNEYLDKVLTHSQDLSEAPINSPLEVPVKNIAELEDLNNRRKIRNASDTVYFKGKSNTHRVWIGQTIQVNLSENVSKKTDMGDWRIINTKITMNQNGKFSNEFEAIPSKLKLAHLPEIKMPTANSVMATVVDNNDPLNLGRIRVSFPFSTLWQSNWMRIMTLDAGSSGQVKENRGLVFIPEVKDQVLVNFEYSDPNRPYVLGSLFHGKNTTGGGQNNHIKSIITRSGIKIVFDDQQGSLHLEDPSGNTVNLDGKGNIDISAPKNINLKAGKNIHLEAQENIYSKAGKDINHSAVYNINQDSGKSTFIYSGLNTEISANQSLDLYGKSNMIFYTDGNSEMGARNNLHMYGYNSMVTAQDTYSFKAPKMEKTKQQGEFEYTKELQIVDVQWLECDCEKETEVTNYNNSVDLLLTLRNCNEGDEVSLELFEQDSQDILENQKTLQVSGTVRADHTILIKNALTFEDSPQEKERKKQEAEQKENELRNNRLRF